MQVLQLIQSGQVRAGIMAHALLEVTGNMSHNTSISQILSLPTRLLVQYGLTVVPDPQSHPGYAGCTFDELVIQIATQMALADAVQAVQIAHHARSAKCLLTWNARHFVGKLVIPVMTPEEWLNQRQASTP
jgi:hypothetical protein